MRHKVKQNTWNTARNMGNSKTRSKTKYKKTTRNMETCKTQSKNKYWKHYEKYGNKVRHKAKRNTRSTTMSMDK